MSAETLTELDQIIRVVVSGFKPDYHDELREHLSQEGSFATFFPSGSWDDVLSDCQKMSPCVWITAEHLMKQVDPAAFGPRVSYGRLVQVLVVGDTDDSEVRRQMLRLGCSGFLPMNVQGKTLRKAVKAVAQGELWADRKLTRQVLQESLQRSSQPSLTPREDQILWMIKEGKTNRAIADSLHITRDTVRWHIRGLYNKIGVKDRLSAVFFAREFFAADASPGSASTKKEWVSHSLELSELGSRSEYLG